MIFDARGCHKTKAERLQFEAMTILELKDALAKWSVDLQDFTKAKNKDAKKKVVLETWFQKYIMPEITGGKPGQANQDKPTSTDKAKRISEALAFKADVSTQELEEEPEYLDKILLLQAEWLDKITAGHKTLELRKTALCKENNPESMYLAVKNKIFAKCIFSHPVTICNVDEFEQLMPSHQCPAAPYSYPFVARRVSKVQLLKPLEYVKLDSCVGRSLYRPLGWKPDAAAPSKPDTAVPEAPGKEGPGSEKVQVKKKTDKVAPGSKKGSTAKEKDAAKSKKSKTSSKGASALHLPAADLLESQDIKVLSHKKHLLPDKERLEKKRKWLQRKDAEFGIRLSGGLLAHLNNEAFKRDQPTLAFLLGHFDKNDTAEVKGLWAHSFENVYAAEFSDEELKSFCEKKTVEIVGACLVNPNGDAALSAEDIDVACKHQKHCHHACVTAVTGKDRMTSFYRVTQEGLEAVNVNAEHVQEVGSKVVWVGQASLYFCFFSWQHENLLAQITSSAAGSISSKKSSLQSKVQSSASSKKAPQYDAKAVASLRICFADYLCVKLPEFAAPTAELRASFEEALKTWPLGAQEMLKVKLAKCPADVSEAATMLSMVHELRTNLEVRTVKRQTNTNHTSDGMKWKRLKGTPSSACKSTPAASPNGSSSSSQGPERSPSARPTPTTPAEDHSPENSSLPPLQDCLHTNI